MANFPKESNRSFVISQEKKTWGGEEREREEVIFLRTDSMFFLTWVSRGSPSWWRPSWEEERPPA